VTKKVAKLFQLNFFQFQKKSYANKLFDKKSKIRRLSCKRIFSLFFAKTVLEKPKMDIYKCPKTRFPEMVLTKIKFCDLYNKLPKGLKEQCNKIECGILV
jgi:hypothetical protein